MENLNRTVATKTARMKQLSKVITGILNDIPKHPGNRAEFNRWLADYRRKLLECAAAINQSVESIAAIIDDTVNSGTPDEHC